MAAEDRLYFVLLSVYKRTYSIVARRLAIRLWRMTLERASTKAESVMREVRSGEPTMKKAGTASAGADPITPHDAQAGSAISAIDQ